MATLFGYTRISTPNQSISRQVRNIKSEYPKSIVIEEIYTATKTDRPEWNKLYNKVTKGDVIIFDSVSRMSRNADEGFQVYQDLFNRGVSLIFLKEHHIDTDTYKKALSSSIPLTGTSVDYILSGINQHLMELAKEQIKIAFEQSQKEVDDLHQRTREGMITAKLNGKQIGRIQGNTYHTKKEKQSLSVIKKLSKDFDGYNTDSEVMAITGLSRGTYYKYKRLLREETN